MIVMTLRKMENEVRINNTIPEKFEIKEGLRQGDPLSSVIFSMTLEKTIREAGINSTGLIYQKKHQCLAFADDLVILARSKQELKEVVERLVENAKKKGLYIKEDKTKYMEWTDQEFREDKTLKVIEDSGKIYEFEEVERLEYLETRFTRRSEIKDEIQNRIMAGNRYIHALSRLLPPIKYN